MTNKKYNLTEALISYGKSGYYPFHMPGHKRTPLDFPNPWTIDITEIDGFDDLHHAEGILADLQELAANLFGAKESFLLINGSTGGLLSAVSGCAAPGSSLLMSRNCHKSVYNGVYLRHLTPVYLMPQTLESGILGSVRPGEVDSALRKNPETGAVLIVSPTYDGVVSDIKTIAKIVHKYEIPLLVDEAHGAHFPFCRDFPASALACGADVVVQSLHKTLPSFTQTAILHINSDMVDTASIRRFLSIYQSSSPSYLLMASMERCLHLLQKSGSVLFSSFTEKLDTFYEKCQKLNYIHVFTKEEHHPDLCFDHDKSKILISGSGAGLSGQDLYDILLHKYHLQMELASGHYTLALTSLMDRDEGFSRLFQALLEIDQNTLGRRKEKSDILYKTKQRAGRSFYHIPKQEMAVFKALELPALTLPLEQAQGRISQEFIYLYPPGIPLLAPGEVIDKDLLKNLTILKKRGLKLEGLSDPANTRINVVNS